MIHLHSLELLDLLLCFVTKTDSRFDQLRTNFVLMSSDSFLDSLSLSVFFFKPQRSSILRNVKTNKDDGSYVYLLLCIPQYISCINGGTTLHLRNSENTKRYTKTYQVSFGTRERMDPVKSLKKCVNHRNCLRSIVKVDVVKKDEYIFPTYGVWVTRFRRCVWVTHTSLS